MSSQSTPRMHGWVTLTGHGAEYLDTGAAGGEGQDNPKKKLVLCHVTMYALVTLMTSGKPRSSSSSQNLVAVMGLIRSQTHVFGVDMFSFKLWASSTTECFVTDKIDVDYQ
jgi:hypothetical protein